MKESPMLGFQNFDEWLMSRIFEPIAWWYEWYTSKSAEYLALACVTLGYIMWAWMSFVLNILILTALLVLVMIPVYTFISVYRARKRMHDRGFQNPERQKWRERIGRILVDLVLVNVLIGYEVPGMLVALFVSGSVFRTAGAYISGANSIPPH